MLKVKRRQHKENRKIWAKLTFYAEPYLRIHKFRNDLIVSSPSLNGIYRQRNESFQFRFRAVWLARFLPWRDSGFDGSFKSIYPLGSLCFSFDIFFSMESVVGVKILISKCQHNLWRDNLLPSTKYRERKKETPPFWRKGRLSFPDIH